MIDIFQDSFHGPFDCLVAKQGDFPVLGPVYICRYAYHLHTRFLHLIVRFDKPNPRVNY